jgi:hypothetical protein
MNPSLLPISPTVSLLSPQAQVRNRYSSVRWPKQRRYLLVTGLGRSPETLCLAVSTDARQSATSLANLDGAPVAEVVARMIGHFLMCGLQVER